MSDQPPPKPRRLCHPLIECRVCKQGAEQMRPGNYLTRLAPIGTNNPEWICKDCLGNQPMTP